MMLEVGFVLPPLTIFEGIYRLWPFSELSVRRESTGYVFSVVDNFDELSLVGVGRLTYEETQNAIGECLSNSLQELSTQIPDRVAVFTLSGGIDSSLLMLLGSKWFETRAVGATVRSPGQESEFQRAVIAARIAGVRDHVIIGVEDISRDSIDEYVTTFAEPIYDMAVPGVVSLLRAVQARLNHEEDLLVIEGQCADTVLLGRPHNLVAQAWEAFPSVTRPLAYMIARIEAQSALKHVRGGRLLYRASKGARVLSSHNNIEAFMTSLGIRGVFRNVMVEYYEILRESVETVISKSPTFQRGIAHFFLSRVLPVREMQKYRLGLRQGIMFAFPYMDERLLSIVRAIPDSFLVTTTSRKRVLFDLAARVLPKDLYTRTTSPFYVGPPGSLGQPRRISNLYREFRMDLRKYRPQVVDYDTFQSSLESLTLFRKAMEKRAEGIDDTLVELGFRVD